MPGAAACVGMLLSLWVSRLTCRLSQSASHQLNKRSGSAPNPRAPHILVELALLFEQECPLCMYKFEISGLFNQLLCVFKFKITWESGLRCESEAGLSCWAPLCRAIKLRFKQQECMTHAVRMYEPVHGSFVSMPDAYGRQVGFIVNASDGVPERLD